MWLIVYEIQQACLGTANVLHRLEENMHEREMKTRMKSSRSRYQLSAFFFGFLILHTKQDGNI